MRKTIKAGVVRFEAEAGVIRTREKCDGRSGSLWLGAVLVALGTGLLLSRMDILDIGHFWTWWGLAPLLYGAVRVVTWQSAQAVASGVSWVLFGVWFLTSANGWWGLDWGSSWPFVFVGIGASIVVKALLEPVFERRDQNSRVPGGEHRV